MTTYKCAVCCSITSTENHCLVNLAEQWRSKHGLSDEAAKNLVDAFTKISTTFYDLLSRKPPASCWWMN